MGCKLKFCETDAREADAACNQGGKAKADKLENKMLASVRAIYGTLLAELAAAGGVEEDELYTDQAKLAHCILALSQRVYEALPANAPRFAEQAAMIARLLFILLADELHNLKPAGSKPDAAVAFWVPFLCHGVLGGRGMKPIPLLPAVHLTFAPCNPNNGPLADAVQEAGQSLLTPRRATVDANGTTIRPPLELSDDDGIEVWDTAALMATLTSISGWRRATSRTAPPATARASPQPPWTPPWASVPSERLALSPPRATPPLPRGPR